jgi:hypothetical protein
MYDVFSEISFNLSDNIINSKMKKDQSKIPVKVLEYLKENFEPGFLFELMRTNRMDGQQVYDIKVFMDNTQIRLWINENGSVIKKESSEVFPTDPSEPGDTPV